MPKGGHIYMGTVCPCEPSKAYCTLHKSFLDKPSSFHSSTHPHHSHCIPDMCSVHCNQLPNILSITFLFNYYYNHIQEVCSCQILYTTLTFRIRGLWNQPPPTLISHGLRSLFRYIDIHIYYILM